MRGKAMIDSDEKTASDGIRKRGGKKRERNEERKRKK